MTTVERMQSNPAAGWYRDPQNPAQERWWDGMSWTDDVRPGVPPPPPAGQFTHPTSPYGAPYTGERPDSYLAWSIVATILCCWPLGIPAIVNAAKVDSAWSRGDHVEARRRSAAAKKWTIASAVTGLVVAVGWVVVAVLGAAAA